MWIENYQRFNQNQQIIFKEILPFFLLFSEIIKSIYKYIVLNVYFRKFHAKNECRKGNKFWNQQNVIKKAEGRFED